MENKNKNMLNNYLIDVSRRTRVLFFSKIVVSPCHTRVRASY